MIRLFEKILDDSLFEEVDINIFAYKANLQTKEVTIKRIRKLWGQLGYQVDDENTEMFIDAVLKNEQP